MKINKIYIVSLCALFLSSCNNFLDEQPTGTMTTDSKLTSQGVRFGLDEFGLFEEYGL